MTPDYDKPAPEYFSKRQEYDKPAPKFFRKQSNQWTPVDSLAPTSHPITPPSLKEQAIAVLEDAELDAAHYNILLRALEQLND